MYPENSIITLFEITSTLHQTQFHVIHIFNNRARKLELRKELWYKKQMKLGKNEDAIVEEEEEDDEDEDWEECSSDEDITDDESIG